LAGRVLLKIVYLFMRWLFGLAVLVARGDRAKDAELLVAHHQELGILGRRTLGQHHLAAEQTAHDEVDD
jgi:hypothetical protein